MRVVEFSKMRDKQIQQRRGRADGTVAAVADRSAVAEDRALAPRTAPASQRWPPVDRQPPCAGRDFVDSAERRSLAGPSGEVSTSFDLLAAVAGLGGAGRLAEHLAGISERVERTRAIGLERIVSGRQFRSGEKRGAGVGKTKRGKGTKWMVVVDGKGVPLGDHLHSASPAEVGLALRRYRRRWVVERTIGWLGNFRRLVVRYDRSLKIYGAFFHIACLMIVLRRVVQ